MKLPRGLRVASISLLVAAAGALAWTTRWGTRWPALYYMTGPSMEPTIAAGRLFLTWAPPGALVRGDLVIFEFSDEDGVFHVLRRLVGLPGDTVAMLAGAVLLNGDPAGWPFRIMAPDAATSPFAVVDDLYTWGPWIVGPDSVLLLSDTRDHLGWPDSRFVGLVPLSRVLAVATRTLRGGSLRP